MSILQRLSPQQTDVLPAPDAEVAALLLDHFEGMAYRCRIDNDWTLEFLSAGCEHLTGYTPHDFLVRRLLTFEELTHRDDRSTVRRLIQHALERDGRFSLEYRIVRRDGAVRWVCEHGRGIRNANGQYIALQGFLQDITERRASERALLETERRYRSIFENAVEGMYQSTLDQGYLTVNPALARMLGYASPSEMIAALPDTGRQLYVDPGRRQDFLRLMRDVGQVSNFEAQVRRRDGTLIWISENARAVRDAHGEIMFFEGTVLDITERRQYEERIRFQATHDALTGLPNRTLLHDRLQQAVQSAQRSGELVAAVFLDLDQFKFVNDSLGHQAGDALLKTVTERLLSSVRVCDTVSRQGGDEFVLLLAGCESREAIEQATLRIINAVAEPMEVGGIELQITCSVGISVYPDDGINAEALLRHADSAMYKAKEAGSNSYVFFDARTTLHAGERLALLSSMRGALAHEEFLLHFQPRIDLASGKLVGAEALIRWRHPEQGMVSPEQFIPLAEDSGLIVVMGEWVLRRACKQNAAWQQAGLPPIPVSVNLSPRQLTQENIVEIVADALHASRLAPQWLELEITETVVMRDVEQSLATLHRLKQLGLSISIDDFGTGYSSLNYLKRFPVDTLKIDRSFVNDIATDADDAAIVKAVISLGHILHLRVLAEGVETEAQRCFLVENGCDQAQGFLFGFPMPPQDFARLCLARAA